ncbi:Uncharacterized protein APZ42_010200 [Daphnia magna]|uniref:Uncharacterized protein n=1 Tax=Daphnia magna TaxID=35525 RepID=A0A162CXG7_9CRUS|nr:Uncharacterized protein APZ42_010200 [Daphnia magna]
MEVEDHRLKQLKTFVLPPYTTTRGRIQFETLCFACYASHIFLVPSELTALMDYMERNWIRGKFWTPDN